MNYTITDKIAELKARIINKEIDIDLMNPLKEGGRYQVAKIELEMLLLELSTLEGYIKEYNDRNNPKVELDIFVVRAQQLDKWIKENPVYKDWYESIDGVTYYDAANLTDEEWKEAIDYKTSLINYARRNE